MNAAITSGFNRMKALCAAQCQPGSMANIWPNRQFPRPFWHICEIIHRKKALVISMHGWTGTGKNYLASLIVEAIYKKGMRSHFVHQFVSNLHFPHDDSIGIYKRQIRQWIRGNVTACERSVFIFDEVDKLTPTVLDAVKPFIDHFEVLDGVDFRKSIFLFLSNSGGEDISLRTLEHHDAGRSRESITLTEMEKLVTENAFNQPGGLKFSELISAQLIDHFVPFLPMERRHVRMCIRDYLQQRGYAVTEDRLMAIAETLQYYPASNPIFSVSGCKKIAQKAELHLMSEENPMRDPFGIEHHGDDHEHDHDEL